MLDVLIVGAGPAGTVAATVLARHGARVRIVDRARFPRDKLCGDTVNPGTLALLRRLDMSDRLEARGLPVAGMIVTGADGVAVESRYPDGLQGRAIVRRELDWSLLQQATAAGADFEPCSSVRRAVLDDQGVSGVIVNDERTIRAPVVIAADGRHSTLAFGLGLARHPEHPRRWAIGAYFEGVRFENAEQRSSFGEMHVRRGGYIGVAPIPGGLANVCLVKPWQASSRAAASSDATFRDPEALLRRELARDPVLRERFSGARLVTPPVVLGPLAVDVKPHAIPGLLLAGDAAGFIDPMTGDGLRFAVRGGELAAHAALRALAGGWTGVHARLAHQRRREFATKWRFNRTLRALVSFAAAVRVGEAVALVAPSALRAVVRRAGDCDLPAGP
jgi:flavin-dependent dehydrogenase